MSVLSLLSDRYGENKPKGWVPVKEPGKGESDPEHQRKLQVC